MNDKPVTNPMLDLSYIRDDDVDFFGIDLADEKSFRLFIKLTEGLCRRTIEYQLWAKRTKMLAHEQNEDPDKDDSSFCPICGLSYEYVDPESHHHPITLFNLCVNTFQSWIDENELRNKQPLDLVYDVMQLHAMGKVEHVVLCKHCHEKYHNGEINIKTELQKIIDFKRSKKIDNYPDTVKELLDIKRRSEESIWKKRKDDQKETFQNIHEDLSQEDILGSIFSQINEREFFENLNKNKD